jgi:hypothetical protein
VSRFRTTSCRSCGAEIVWARTEKGKRAPIDAAIDDKGTIVLRAPREGERDPLAIFGVPPDVFAGEPRHTSHFATCPDADRWRRRPLEPA